MTHNADWYRNLDWEATSFHGPIEAAVHYALIEFILEIEDRDRQRTILSTPDLSDIYRKWRQTIIQIANGDTDAAEWLAEREATE